MRDFIRPFVMAFILIAVATLSGRPLSASPQISSPSPDGVWHDVAEATIQVKGERLIVPDAYRTIALDAAQLQTVLASAPMENPSGATASNIVLHLPMPDGAYHRFRIWESPIMAPALAAQYPSIKTYVGQGLDDPSATVRMDRTPAGFHAMILSSSGRGTVFVDPYSRNDTTNYISYYTSEYSLPLSKEFDELGVEQAADGPQAAPSKVTGPSGDTLRTYRLAMAATGEYTIFHGGTVELGLAAIVTSMNRVNGVYERDVAVRMTLIANNNIIVYTNPATDPYTNNDGFAMLAQNQTNLTAVIGSANYDIGHVFSTGGGGVAGLRVVCVTSSKARGVTGSSSPVGDPFDIDYVAHEIGHQFGGNHTFNGTTSSCGGGNRSAAAAYEPGSGSTIQAYAGICGAENLQPNSDDYFHRKSLDEIVAFITNPSTGDSCAARTPTGNTPPTVDAGAPYTIPANTFFKLTATGSDPDGDPLTYTWEQYNLGTASPPNTDNGNRPIFRSFTGTSNPTRFFPKLSDIVNNISSFGESLPTTNRNLTFRVTARDNRANGGGTNDAQVALTVSADAGPFLVTAPNTAVTWADGTQETVTWNVANTHIAPVNCPAVDVLLSTNGGNTFPTTLLDNTPNDGSETVTVPDLPTTQARVQVICSDNIFFDISNVNFTITGAGNTATPTAQPTSTSTSTAPPTATAQNTATSTTVASTSTSIASTATSVASTATNTTVAPSQTSVATSTVMATATVAACSLQYVDVSSTNVFYTFVRCLACQGIVSGYECGGPGEPCNGQQQPYFRPNNNVTRGQIAKIVSNSAGYSDNPGAQRFQDVPPSNTFYAWINRLASRGHMGGYDCGGAGEPCVAPANLPYFRPFADATRGQLSKIVSNAANLTNTPTSQTFTDVPPSNTFYLFIERLASVGVIGGYDCGGPGEPCNGQQQPYFRPNNSVTRGQTTKIVSGTFFADCDPGAPR